MPRVGGGHFLIGAEGLPASDQIIFLEKAPAAVELTIPVMIRSTTAGDMVTALDAITLALTTDAEALLLLDYDPDAPNRGRMAMWNRVPLQKTWLNSCAMRTQITFIAQPVMVAVAPITSTSTVP